MKRLCSIVLSIALALSLAMHAFPADVEGFTDVQGHWAAQSIEKWSDMGIIRGDEESGAFRPNDGLTRAELATVLDGLMIYAEGDSAGYTDLPTGVWFSDVMSKLVSAGIVSGYGDGTVRPAGMVNRQEAAVMLCRAFGIEPGEGPVDFADWQDVADWAKGAVSVLHARGIITGDETGFHPQEPVTRAQLMSMLDRLVDTMVTKSGTFSQNVDGSLLVNAAGVRLENMNIAGDLIIADGVGDGDVYAKNVKVLGNVVLRGCGENSFHLLGDFEVTGKIIVTKTTKGAIRVVNESGKTIPMIYVQDGKSGVVISGKADTVVIACDTPVSLENAVIGTVSVTAKNTAVTVGKNSTVSRLDVGAKAEGTALHVAGKVTSLSLNAAATVDNTGTISSIQLAPGVSQPVDSNGNTVSGTTGTGTSGGGTVTPPAADTKITSVKLQLMAPAFGNIPDTADELDAGYSAVTKWQNEGGAPASYRWKANADAPDTFTAGQAYEAVITLTPNVGYTFADSLTVTVTDGMEPAREYTPVSVTEDGGGYVVLMRYEPTISVDVLESVWVSGPEALGLGETGTLDALPRHNSLMDPALFAYQWYRCDENGSGATLVPGAEDDTYTITAEETAAETTLHYLCKVSAMGQTVSSNVYNVVVEDTFDASTIPVPTIKNITFNADDYSGRVTVYCELENLVEHTGLVYAVSGVVSTQQYGAYSSEDGYTNLYERKLGSKVASIISDGTAVVSVELMSYEGIANGYQYIVKQDWNELVVTVQAWYKSEAVEGKSSSKTLSGDAALLTIYNNTKVELPEAPVRVPYNGLLTVNATTGQCEYTLEGVYSYDYGGDLKSYWGFLTLYSSGMPYSCGRCGPVEMDKGVVWHGGLRTHLNATGESMYATMSYVYKVPEENRIILTSVDCYQIELINSQG